MFEGQQPSPFSWNCGLPFCSNFASPIASRPAIYYEDTGAVHARPLIQEDTNAPFTPPRDAKTGMSEILFSKLHSMQSPLSNLCGAGGLSETPDRDHATYVEPILWSDLLPSNEPTPQRNRQSPPSMADNGMTLDFSDDTLPGESHLPGPISRNLSKRITFSSPPSGWSQKLRVGRANTPISKKCLAAPFSVTKPLSEGGEALLHINQMVNRALPPTRLRPEGSNVSRTPTSDDGGNPAQKSADNSAVLSTPNPQMLRSTAVAGVAPSPASMSALQVKFTRQPLSSSALSHLICRSLSGCRALRLKMCNSSGNPCAMKSICVHQVKDPLGLYHNA